jgi:hypothetical protein
VPSSSTATADVTAQIQLSSAQTLPTSSPWAITVSATIRILFVTIHHTPFDIDVLLIGLQA